MDVKQQFETLLRMTKKFVKENDFKNAAAAFSELASFCYAESQKTYNSDVVNRGIRSRAIIFDEYSAFIKRNNGFSASIMHMFGISYNVVKRAETPNEPANDVLDEIPKKDEEKKPENKEIEDVFDFWQPAKEDGDEKLGTYHSEKKSSKYDYK